MTISLTLPEQTRQEQHHPIFATDLPHILDRYAGKIKTLSLDCFDTLLWRNTAAPKDIFFALEERPLFRSLGVTAWQRISAAAKAYRHQFIEHGNHDIHLRDIYRQFTSLSEAQQLALAEEELSLEMQSLYAFLPVVKLIRDAHARGIKIIIVSDIYYTEAELRRILSHCLPHDVMSMISMIFSSCDYNRSKKNGLFSVILSKLSEPAHAVLHLGDHREADFEAPLKLGIHAFHLLHHDAKTAEILRMQNNAAALSSLISPQMGLTRAARFNPYRGILAATRLTTEKPETLIGYMTFGPMLYAFARFITDEIAALEKSGKKLKVFFLLRDAYLLSRACEIYAGKPVGKLVRLRKFVSVASSFRTREDVKRYLVSLGTQHYNFWVICEQLLIPANLAESIIQRALSAPEPEKSFNELILRGDILAIVFQNSADYRARFLKYIKKEMNLENGDTVMLVDTGYIGLTQRHLSMTLKNELDVEVIGRYFITSHEPDSPECKALMTSTACDHVLFEQSCTFKEGCVLDYNEEGDPIFDNVKLSAEQYSKAQAIQDEALRFVNAAKMYFTASGITPDFSVLQNTAIAALRRHVYFPTVEEVNYFHNFQHDKDMGADLRKTIYHVANSFNTLRESVSAAALQPYAARAATMEVSLSNMLTRFFELELTEQDMSLQQEHLEIILLQGGQSSKVTLCALPTHEGYFSVFIPFLQNTHIGILFGQLYQWVQVHSVKLVNMVTRAAHDVANHLAVDQMTQRSGNLFECVDKAGVMTIKPIALEQPVQQPLVFQVVFRPIIPSTPT